jgi:ribosomal-protein-alanine N-acetyltransferase
VIRRLRQDDAEELAALLRANRDFLAPFEPVRDERFFTAEGQAARIAQHGHLFAIMDDGEIAGTIAISNVLLGALRSANVGYWVDRARNGRGLASAAVAAVAETAFGELELHRLEAGTLVDNIGSQRVLERNRFTRIGIAPRYLHIGGAWRDHVLFQLLAG